MPPDPYVAAEVQPYAYALNKLRAGLARRHRTPCRIVFAGSSTTAGLYASAEPLRYANLVLDKLQQAYPSILPIEAPMLTVDAAYAAPSALPGVHGYNAGVSGTDSGSYLTPTSINRIAALNPSAVIHVVGSNDYANGVDPRTYRANIKAKIDALSAAVPGPCVHVLAHPYRRGDVTAPAYQWDEYKDALAELAYRLPHTVVFLDLTRDYRILGRTESNPLGLFNADLVHQSDAGHALMAELIYGYLGLASQRPARTLVSDTFTRPNAASLGNAETGQPWTTSASWAITDGYAAPASGGNGNVFVEAGTPNVDAAVLVTYGNTGGLLFRAADDGNRLGLFTDSANGLSLYKADGGAATMLTAVPFSWTVGRAYVLRVIAKGDTIVGYVDGVPLLTYVLSASDQTKYGALTKVGFRLTGASATARFDNLAVRQA